MKTFISVDIGISNQGVVKICEFPDGRIQTLVMQNHHACSLKDPDTGRKRPRKHLMDAYRSMLAKDLTPLLNGVDEACVELQIRDLEITLSYELCNFLCGHAIPARFVSARLKNKLCATTKTGIERKNYGKNSHSFNKACAKAALPHLIDPAGKILYESLGASRGHCADAWLQWKATRMVAKQELSVCEPITARRRAGARRFKYRGPDLRTQIRMASFATPSLTDM